MAIEQFTYYMVQKKLSKYLEIRIKRFEIGIKQIKQDWGINRVKTWLDGIKGKDARQAGIQETSSNGENSHATKWCNNERTFRDIIWRNEESCCAKVAVKSFCTSYTNNSGNCTIFEARSNKRSLHWRTREEDIGWGGRGEIVFWNRENHLTFNKLSQARKDKSLRFIVEPIQLRLRSVATYTTRLAVSDRPIQFK